MRVKLIIFTVLHLIRYGCSLLPPEYALDLTVTDTFIISDVFDKDDASDFSDDDMEIIKDSDLTMLKPGSKKKYFMLDQLTERKNRETEEKSTIVKVDNDKFQKHPDYNYDFEDVESYGEFLDSNDIEHDNSKNKRLINQTSRGIQKRDDYQYAVLKAEYDQLAAKEAKDKNVLKYEDVTEKEGLKDAAKNIIKHKSPKNCTAEEMKGIGVNAINCFFKDMKKINKKPKQYRNNLLKRLFKLMLIWIGVYAVIAIPAWCTKGWCCCCCRCKMCKPKITIEETKQFLANNPVGVLHIDGKEVTYTPTAHEQYAQQRLEKVLMKL